MNLDALLLFPGFLGEGRYPIVLGRRTAKPPIPKTRRNRNISFISSTCLRQIRLSTSTPHLHIPASILKSRRPAKLVRIFCRRLVNRRPSHLLETSTHIKMYQRSQNTYQTKSPPCINLKTLHKQFKLMMNRSQRAFMIVLPLNRIYQKIMNRQLRNQLRKKIQHYSYGLNDHLDLTKRSNIFRGVDQSSEERVAIKVIDIRNKDTDPLIREHLPLEIQAIKKLAHLNIIRCLDVYSTVNNCYIITQFCEGGDLQNRSQLRGALPEDQVLPLLKDLLVGYMQIAHDKFIHGGLKLSSLMFKDGVLKICGFSNVRKSSRPDIVREMPFNPFQSPESVREGIFNHKTDVWSIGMILYVLIHGQNAFPRGKQQLLQPQLTPLALDPTLSDDVKDFIKSTLTLHPTRLSLQQMFNHPLSKKLLNGYFTTDKYLLNVIAQDVTQNKNKRDHHVAKVQKHIICQINWMRFLFRLMDRISSVHEEGPTVILKFIVLRQLVVQYQNIRKHLILGENVFDFNYWAQFWQSKDRVKKFKEAFAKNQSRVEKAKQAYFKLLQKLSPKRNLPRGMSQLLNDNFVISQYNSIFALNASVHQIKRIWQRIVRQYPPRGKYTPETQFKYKNELLVVDFITTYYQENSLLVEDFQRIDYFQKMSKLQMILDHPPAELDPTHISFLEDKLKSLGLI